MYSLKSQELTVWVLDPATDQARLGARYCRGGYIYQVLDAERGPLCSGPGYPSEFYPPVFDGQGLPEAFRNPLGADGAVHEGDDVALVLGVGLGANLARPQTQTVVDPCAWEVSGDDAALSFATRHAWQGWGAEIVRKVSVCHRTIRSATTLRNTGERTIPLRWFPHPFYPQLETGECCKFSFPVSFPDNPGYALRDNGWIVRKLDHPWDRRGHFQEVTFAPGKELVILQRHPLVGMVSAICEFAPSYMPIWGNVNTFSFEPYLEQPVAPGQTLTWAVVYDF